ncbi:hypothetical protein A2U01_0069381, partial [Trifolium medium]|nr:hypothetical protein [Trifolium medium]
MSNHMSQHSVQQRNQKADHMSQHHAQHVAPQYKEYKGPFRRCDFCGKSGHIMSQCFKAHGYPQKPKSPKQNKKEIQTQ